MTIFGPDISNNNGVVDIDRVADEGFDFVFAKVSEGAYFGDRFWPRTRDWCAQRALICVGYHYVRLDNPDLQAQMFINNGGGGKAMLDFETNSGGIDNFWNVLHAFNSRGVEVVLSYIPHWYWQQIGKPDLSGVPGLISSSYYEQNNYAAKEYGDAGGDNGQGWYGYGNNVPLLWQFTDAATIAGMELDCNAFRGTKADLAAVLGLSAPLLIPDVEGLYV